MLTSGYLRPLESKVRQQDTDSRAEYSMNTHASALLLEADVQTFSLSNAGSSAVGMRLS